MKRILRFLKSTAGPTAVEYALLLALIVGTMVAAITLVGVQTQELSDDTVEALDT